MECSLEIDVGLGITCETIRNVIVKARRPHICLECGELIPVGDRYERFTGKDDGQIFTHETCEDCLSVRNAFFATFFFGFLWENLRQEIQEIFGEVPEVCLALLTPKAREKVCELIEEEWEGRDDDE